MNSTLKERVTTRYFEAKNVAKRLVGIVSTYHDARRAAGEMQAQFTGKIEGHPEDIISGNTCCLVCGGLKTAYMNAPQHTEDCPIGRIVAGFADPRVRAILVDAARQSGELAYGNTRTMTGPDTVNIYRNDPASPTGVKHWFSVSRSEYGGPVYQGPCRGDMACEETR